MTPQSLAQKVIELAQSSDFRGEPSSVVFAAATYLALAAISEEQHSREFMVHRRRLVDLLGLNRAGVYRQLDLLRTFELIRCSHLKNNTLQIAILGPTAE